LKFEIFKQNKRSQNFFILISEISLIFNFNLQCIVWFRPNWRLLHILSMTVTLWCTIKINQSQFEIVKNSLFWLINSYDTFYNYCYRMCAGPLTNAWTNASSVSFKHTHTYIYIYIYIHLSLLYIAGIYW